MGIHTQYFIEDERFCRSTNSILEHTRYLDRIQTYLSVQDNQVIVNDISARDIFLNFQKAEFDLVWADFSNDSLSDSEQVLFEQPEEVTKGERDLWKELETIQPVFTYSTSMDPNYEIERGDKFDRIFNEGITNSTEIITNDPMISSSFELATPQHPFEETLQLPEDSMEDIESPRSTIYYPSSPEEDNTDDITHTAKAQELSATHPSPPPTGYPNSIHSYSQPSAVNDASEDDVVVEDIPLTNESVLADSTSQRNNKLRGVQNTSPFKSKVRRRQRKSKVFKITISEGVKDSPKKRTFANGKQKLYALKPLADPEAEKARQNAINAKKNRDLKKKEKEMIAHEVVTLKKENGTLRKNAAGLKKRALEAEAELRRLRAAISANHLMDVIKASGNNDKESSKVSYFNINNSSDVDLESLWG